MDFKQDYAAIYRARKDILKPVVALDEVRLSHLLGIESQKKALLTNTLRFIQNKSFHHALLWGSRGTGKSSLIKAVFNELKEQNLRLVQIDKQDLNALADIIDELRLLAFKFIIFCDDLSFENKDESYKFLKPLLEGSIEKTPSNIVLYATSNRRHLLAEYESDNENAEILGNELHLGDVKEEKLSLSDRFGLWLSFYPQNLEHYLHLVDFYFKDYQGDKSLLHAKAKQFASFRASHSPRTAKQFYLSFKEN